MFSFVLSLAEKRFFTCELPIKGYIKRLLNVSLLPSKVRRNGLFWLPQERASLAKVYGHPIKERVTEGNEWLMEWPKTFARRASDWGSQNKPLRRTLEGSNDTFFHFSWKRLLLSTTVDGKVSVKCIAKTFASGKTEKLVYDSLASLDLPSGKVSYQTTPTFC